MSWFHTPPPPVPAELPLIVQSFTASVPALYSPPPVLAAVLFSTVVSFRVTVGYTPLSLAAPMPPPLSAPAVLSLTVQ